ncbi:MAG: CRISPR-associated endonuclease Cas1 [Burkholderia sp.]|jgi:CRISP-associated protein Cas1
MLGRIVEIASDACHISLYRGFLMVYQKGEGNRELGRIPLDDITAVIAHAHGLSYTNNVLVALAERDIPFVLCNDRHSAVGMLWPVDGHHQQARRFDAQIAASLPKKKQLWASIVKSKIAQQAHALRYFTDSEHENYLMALSKQVRSGDPDNKEAQAARFYWRVLFGDDFVRDRNAGDANALLNYGYIVLRSAMARAVIAAGLHPSIGLHHSNDSNAMRLVDDLMEPFRPLVDFQVKKMLIQAVHAPKVSPESKRQLVSCLYFDAVKGSDRCPVMVAMQKMATSLAQVFLKDRKSLYIPERFSAAHESLDDE